jgi:hypothetical protein
MLRLLYDALSLSRGFRAIALNETAKVAYWPRSKSYREVRAVEEGDNDERRGVLPS